MNVTFKGNDMYFSNGTDPFFSSPYGHFGRIYMGRVVSPVRQIGWMKDAVFVVAGGDCCHGYVMTVPVRGKGGKGVELDINAYFLYPIVLKDRRVLMLISGAGCDGIGVRIVDFDEEEPRMTTVIDGREDTVWTRSHAWYHRDPLTHPRLWPLLEKLGIDVDYESTAYAHASLWWRPVGRWGNEGHEH